MYFKKENILFLFFITIISILIIALMMYLSQNCCFGGDDSWYAIYRPEESLFSCLFGDVSHEHGGYYIGYFLCKFLSFGLPNLLSIHPADFITYGHGFLRGVFVVIGLLLIANFSVFYKKSKLILCTTFLFLTFYFFYNAIQCYVIIINYNFYRYFFSFIFFSIFWYYILTNILLPPPESKNEKYEKLNLLGVTICGFILGTSIEISFYVSAFLAFLLVFYNTVLSLFSFIFKNKNILIHKYNLGLKFYIPILGLFSGIILFVTNPGSIEVAKDRGMANIHINLDILKEYLQLYFQVCFKDHLIYWIIFIILFSISLYFAFKNHIIKDIAFPLFIQFSILTVMFSLVLCGKTFDGFYFLCHHNIIFLYKIIILYPVFLYFNFIFNNIETLWKKRIYITLIFLSVIISSALNSATIYETIQYRYLCLLDFEKSRQISYIGEKIFRFYALKGEKIAILPNYFGIIEVIYPFYRLCPDNNLFDESINNAHANDYYKRIYKDEKIYYYSFKEEQDALDLFYSKGGTFTEEELKHIKFSRLFDKKFVLNEK